LFFRYTKNHSNMNMFILYATPLAARRLPGGHVEVCVTVAMVTRDVISYVTSLQFSLRHAKSRCAHRLNIFMLKLLLTASIMHISIYINADGFVFICWLSYCFLWEKSFPTFKLLSFSKANPRLERPAIAELIVVCLMHYGIDISLFWFNYIIIILCFFTAERNKTAGWLVGNSVMK
jgi:hypothetical protein